MLKKPDNAKNKPKIDEYINKGKKQNINIGEKSEILLYKGGFDNTGKGTPEGDGKDKAMRKIADGFIGEVVSEKGKTSANTSAIEIQNKDKSGNTEIYFDSEDNTILSGVENPKVIMLARNSEFKGKELSIFTKKEILSSNFCINNEEILLCQ